MKYLGISNDEKYLFTNKGFFVLSESDNENFKFINYGDKLIDNLVTITESDTFYQFKNGNIDKLEFISKPRKFLSTLLEGLDVNIDHKLNILIEWDKKFSKNLLLINESIDDVVFENNIHESWNEITLISEDIIDDIKSGFGSAWEGLKNVTKNVILPIIKQGVLPFLRWIRRNLNTYFGIIADVILSMFPTVVVMKTIWGLIVLLDLYEIVTGDYDSEDPERREMPFLFLITDIISLFFTQAAGKTASIALKTAIKTGANTTTKGILVKLVEKLPSLSKFLSDAKNVIVKLFGENVGKFVGTIFNSIDNVITKLVNWINTTFKINVKALSKTASEIGTKKGAGKLIKSGVIGTVIAEFFEDKKLKEGDKGDEVKELQKRLTNITNTDFGKFVGFNSEIDGIYGPKTKESVRKLQEFLHQEESGKNIVPDGNADVQTLGVLGIVLQPTGVFKFLEPITKPTKEFLSKSLLNINNKLVDIYNNHISNITSTQKVKTKNG